MAEVLVLAEHTDSGEVKKVTLELLTAARRLGSPSVVWTGPGSDAGIARLREYGAEKVYVADSPDFSGYIVAPTAELLAQLVASVPIGTRSAIAMAPVSRPSSIFITMTPVSLSPAMTARWIGAAPRQRGSSEAWRLKQPRGKVSRIDFGRISP